MNKQYIGDGVYVEQDGSDLVLTTENGIETTNIIVLESEVLNNIFRYLKLKVTKEVDSDFEQTVGE
jgi:hypothetical protein